MRDVILNQHEQIQRSLDVNKEIKIEGQFDSIILAGMGGSGHPGDLLNALSLAKAPLYVHRNYDLPITYLAHMGLMKPLIIISSYSGNTEEALSSYQAARNHSLPIMVSSAGGELAQQAQSHGVPWIRVAFTDMQPRHTLLAAFTGIYAALKNSGLAEDVTSDLQAASEFLQKNMVAWEESARELAEKIKGRIPVYISSDSLGFAVKNFKIQTNENAKYPAFWNTFPELNHNEMVGFSQLKEMKNNNKFIVIMLRDNDDHPRNKIRLDVTADLYTKWGVTVEQFPVRGKTLIEKIFGAVMFGLWTTYYLAKEYGIDPLPVEGVETFKAKLKETAGT